MDQALQESGFLLIENHGVPACGTASATRRAWFFALPPARKARYATPVGGRGWIPQGGEANAFYGEVADAERADLKERLAIGRSLGAGDDETDEMWFAPDVWPAECPDWKDLCEEFTAQVRDLYSELLRMCALALSLAEDSFVARTVAAPHSFNINRYPPLTVTGARLGKASSVSPRTPTGES